jgi:serine/threonine-protein kinase
LFQYPGEPTIKLIDNPVVSKESEINDSLVGEYERVLAEIVGPIAVFLVQDALASFPNISREELVEILSAEIADPQKAAEFKQQFQDLT